MNVLMSSSDTGIDAIHVGAVDCSRWCKGSLVTAALEERIALGIVQKSGSGSASMLETFRYLTVSVDGNNNVQTAHEVACEIARFSQEFKVVTNETNGIERLTFDHHMLAGLVAPSGRSVIDNLRHHWSSPWSSYGCMTAAREGYKALSAQRALGYSEAANDTHCQFPVAERSRKEQVLGQVAAWKSGCQISPGQKASLTRDEKVWIDWETSVLS